MAETAPADSRSSQRFAEFLRATLDGSEDPASVARIASAAASRLGLNDEQLAAALAELGAADGSLDTSAANDAIALAVADSETLVAAAAAASSTLTNSAGLADEFPHLEIRLGGPLRPGRRAAADFDLRWQATAEPPRVRMALSAALDQAGWLAEPRLRREANGHFGWRAEFNLTSGGEPCQPGHYFLAVEVAFPKTGGGEPRQSGALAETCPYHFFRSDIRLTVGAEGDSEGPVLEISADKQAAVHLADYDLSAFARVQLHGTDRSILSVGKAPDAPTPTRSHLQFRGAMVADVERRKTWPRVSRVFTDTARLERAALVFGDGRRTLLLARRSVLLGRHRANDIVLRFPAGSDDFERATTAISRTHGAIDFDERGVWIRDLGSNYGTAVDGRLAAEPVLLTAAGPAGPQRHSLALAAESPIRPLELEMTLFAAGPVRGAAPRRPDEVAIYCEALSVATPLLWQTAATSRADCLRLERRDNLPEDYILVAGPVILGGGRTAAVPLDGITSEAARIVYLGGAFFLERIGDIDVKVEGRQLETLELVPLVPSMRLTVGNTPIEFERFEQPYLDVGSGQTADLKVD